MPETTVVIAARDHGTRAAIRDVLDPARVRVVGEACHRWDAGELLRDLQPDAVLVDVSLLATREFFLTGWGPVSRATRVVAVGPADPHLARMLLAHGVSAYISHDRLAEELPTSLDPTVSGARI